MKYFNNIDLQKNQLLQGVIHPTGTAPSSPVTGQTYYDTGTLQLLTWSGSAWRHLATDSALLNGQANTFYLSRTNHTGTQLAATISDLSTTVRSYTLDTFSVPAANVSFNSKTLTNLSDPTSAQDAATKNYVDTQLQQASAGIDSKPSVRLLANSNITLSGTQTIDGVSAIAGDRVLVRGQSTGSQNGVYVVAAGAWTRAVDADATGELTPGAFWFVEEGTTYGKTQWRIENTGTITLGSTAITINQFGAAGSYLAGNGLTLGGSTFSVTPVASGGITVSGSGVAVDTTIVARKYSTSIGNGSLTSIPITHNLGTKDVQVTFRLVSTDEFVLVDWTATDTNTVTASFATAPASSAIRVTVIG